MEDGYVRLEAGGGAGPAAVVAMSLGFVEDHISVRCGFVEKRHFCGVLIAGALRVGSEVLLVDDAGTFGRPRQRSYRVAALGR